MRPGVFAGRGGECTWLVGLRGLWAIGRGGGRSRVRRRSGRGRGGRGLSRRRVGGTFERDAGGDEAVEGVGQRGTGGVKEREVVEAGVAGGGGGAPRDSQVLRPM